MKIILWIVAAIAGISILSGSCEACEGCDGCDSGCDHEWVVTGIKAPDCDDYGYTMNRCEKCDRYRETNSRDPLGHDEVITKGRTEPNCTQTGLTEEKYCNRCKKTYQTQDIIPALGHKPVVTREGLEAKCTSAGFEQELTCSVCNVIIQEPTLINPLGHADTDNDFSCDRCYDFSGDRSLMVTITTEEELRAISDNMSGLYQLGANITLSSGWTPIGTAEAPFKGYFDGCSYSISGLNISNQTLGGVFGYNAGKITNVKVENVSLSTVINGDENTQDTSSVMGGLVAYNQGIISNCSVDGTNTITNTISIKEDKGWPSYDGEYHVFKGIYGGICGVNTGKILNSIVISGFNGTANNTCDFTTSPLLVSNYDMQVDSHYTYGGITGENQGSVTDCTAENANTHSITLSSKSNNKGLSIAVTYANVGSLIGCNTATGTVKGCKGKAIVLSKNVPDNKTSETGVANSLVGTMCTLSLPTSKYQGVIGEAKGTITEITTTA